MSDNMTKTHNDLRIKISSILRNSKDIRNYEIFFKSIPESLEKENFKFERYSSVFINFQGYLFKGDVYEIKKGRMKPYFICYLRSIIDETKTIIADFLILLERDDLVLN